MEVPAEIQKRVTMKILEGITLIEKKYGKRLPTPRVLYDITNTTAGTANYKRWTLRFNPVLLVQNTDEFIKNTVPHELAHLATDMIHPEAHRPLQTSTKRMKRDIHGKQWAAIMLVLGANPSRSHTYVTAGIARHRESYIYQCSECNRLVTIGSVRHDRLQQRPGAYHCACSSESVLNFVRAVPPRTKMMAASYIPRGGSKLEECMRLFNAQHTNVSRRDMISVFVNDIGLSQAAATTYYAKCRSAHISSNT